MKTFLAVPPVPSSRPAADVRYLLVNAPLTDPTQPYHSISYLTGAARADGFTGARVCDANIEALNYLAQPEKVARLLALAAKVRDRAGKAGQLTRDDELRYRAALAGCGLSPDFVRQAVEVFRDPEVFYDYPAYRQAVMAVKRWLELLGLAGVPGTYQDFLVRPQAIINLASHADLACPEAVRTVTGPFEEYIEGPFTALLAEQPWELIGFSLNYVSQLPFGLRLARQARAVCPDARIVFGGTEVCDIVRFTRPGADFWAIFPDVDAVVPGEGETPLRRLLACCRDGADPSGIPGVLTRAGQRQPLTVNYENVAALPAPAYDVWDWNAYWSPEPVVLYSPTRGCYWNKCTFCDYGLNTDRPTSPSRERPVDSVLADLRDIAEFSGVVYFAVDAMSPRYLRQLCEAMAASPLRLRWGAELRLERTFPKREMAGLLRRSGCACVSFGYESGSQRVLDLIDKGVRVDQVPTILADLAAHDIGVEMMGFTGFPGESEREAAETYEFLVRHGDKWSIAGIGAYGLTPGSIVAKAPERFGVTLLPGAAADDIRRLLPWHDRALAESHWPGEAARRVPPELRAAVLRCVDDRPFVGGIDTAHTILYFARNGRRLIPEPDGAREPATAGRMAPSATITIPFAGLDQFTTVGGVERQYQRLQRSGGASHAGMMAWLREPGTARRGQAHVLVLPSGLAVTLPAAAGQVTAEAVEKLAMLVAKTRGAA